MKTNNLSHDQRKLSDLYLLNSSLPVIAITPAAHPQIVNERLFRQDYIVLLPLEIRVTPPLIWLFASLQFSRNKVSGFFAKNKPLSGQVLPGFEVDRM